MTAGRGDLAAWPPPNLVRRGRGVAAPLIPRLGGRGLPRSVTGYAGGSAGSPSGPAVSPGRGWRRCPQPSRRGSEDEGRQVVHAGIRRVVRSLAVPVGGGGAARITFVRS